MKKLAPIELSAPKLLCIESDLLINHEKYKKIILIFLKKLVWKKYIHYHIIFSSLKKIVEYVTKSMMQRFNIQRIFHKKLNSKHRFLNNIHEIINII